MEGVQEPTALQTVVGHSGEVTCVDTGVGLMASGSGDRALVLWRWAAAGWEEVARIPRAHRYGVTALRLSPGGASLLASGGLEGAVRVWSTRSLEARRTLSAPGAAAVRGLCWASGARVLTGHDDGVLCVWRVRPAQLQARLRAHEGALHAVAALARDSLLLTACTDGVLKVYDFSEVCRIGADEASAPAPLTWLDGAHDLGALCADATEEGDVAATGGHDGVVRVWHTAGGEGLRAVDALVGHASAVTAVRWARGGHLLASAAMDRTARLWAAAPAAACLHVLHGHARYLTCVAFAPDARYILTGSNDKTVKMWSLTNLSLGDELTTPCVALEHFALGDLEGIERVDDAWEGAAAVPVDEEAGELGAGASAQRVCLESAAGSGPINSITTHSDTVVAASSDGWLRVYRWTENEEEGEGQLQLVLALSAHQYGAMAVDLGAGGALLLSAGLDTRACLWDVQTGLLLRAMSTGEGGVRGARLCPRGPACMLLATDDGVARLWRLPERAGGPDPSLELLMDNGCEALTCCAWSHDAALVVAGDANGELHVRVVEPRAALHVERAAHDLGMQSCDIAPSSEDLDLPPDTHLLATAGSDSFIKLWLITVEKEDGETVAAGVSVRCLCRVAAHGGGVACVRWGASGAASLLASGGADGWARVWRAEPRGRVLQLECAVAASSRPVLSVALLTGLLIAGSLTGELSVWRLPPSPPTAPPALEDEGSAPGLWGTPAVMRWLTENVTCTPGAQMAPEEQGKILGKCLEANVTGARLIGAEIDDVMNDLGYGGDAAESSPGALRLRRELQWLRRASPPLALERAAPHALLCPLSHRLLREPARAADGYSYERDHIVAWFIAAEGAISPITGRRLRNARVPTNHALRERLRQFITEHEHEHEHAHEYEPGPATAK